MPFTKEPNDFYSPFSLVCAVRVHPSYAVSRSVEWKRLVHRQTFELASIETPVSEISIDGGKVRLRTPQSQPCQWRDYKAVNLHFLGVKAFFQDNDTLVDWVNQQPPSNPLICLGDGHSGIGNLFASIANSAQRREILDWYHLVENLGKLSRI